MVKRRIITRWCEYHLPSTIFFMNTILSCVFLLQCSARDTITINSLLNDGETLVSAGERFELGFFSPTESSADINRYVGIWYYKSNPRIFVWVANRDKPITDYSRQAVLAIGDGNLKLLDKTGAPYFYTEVESSSSPYRVAKLMDSGNLVLRDNQSATNLWESFKHPTDTFLAGMKLDDNLWLTSWNSQDDPKPGNFTFKMDQGVNQYQIQKRAVRYWRNAESQEVFSSDEIMPYQIFYLLSNFSRSVKRTKISIYNNLSMSTINYTYTRLVMNFTGEIQFWSQDKVKGWSLIWWEPRDNCSVLQFCGTFGSCNSNYKPECKCLPGFQPVSPENWNSGEFSGGCNRKSALSCGREDIFFRLKRMKVKGPDSRTQLTNETECMMECRNTCQCQAFSFQESNSATRDNPSGTPGNCWIWTDNLNDLRENSADGGLDLHVRVAASDIESTKRNCDICGTNLVPYPLSTERDCGDPNYFSFLCNTSTGLVSFKAPNQIYLVTRINPNTRSFIVQLKAADTYQRNLNGGFELNQSLPFRFSGLPNADLGNYSIDTSSIFIDEVEIGWEPPEEPTCSSPSDCKDWPHSTCNLTVNGERRCLCEKTFRWDGIALNCTQELLNNTLGGNNTKQWQDEAPNGRYKQWALIVGVTAASVFILFCTIIYFYTRTKKATNQDRTILRPNMAVRFYDSERHVKDMVEMSQFKEEDKKSIDLPFYDFESILAATDNFSEVNKLGKGGFGPVYKGKFPESQEIAVKRLSSASGQGLEEFKNEVVLIARLQHRNLVRLLGYCIEGSEKILLYEYMPNKSLDHFIFDRTLSVLLDWETRFNIILGVARGLLYLHQDSRLRIIHRDLKTSNILLDQEMNPKISDFGLARIFEGKQTEGATNRVVGTYGYMSPEYALDGFFSVKSDVFSFGVVVLEIISGRKNTGFYNSEEALSLIGYAWRLWQNDKALDIMDEKLGENSKTSEILKCINLGLLCVQEDPNDRPTMSNIVIMLGSEATALPVPKRPAFVLRRGPSSMATSSSSSKPEINAELTITLEGR
ncbi:S-locus lectin protein kinase family protein [Melia azedarach]|uniref:S-locus lectin protein kinase family protein n=1 Tax=Melia azedarach TaxID=155640 RepID=A0ACC1Z2F5_MELAZ|nr:S-locus lectin protein kinase family protein [Melia azedarach]